MRHGKTDWNKEYRLQGSVDIPLNEEGVCMAREAALEYKDVNFDVCYCSPLTRARQTAEIVLKNRNIPVIIEPRITEMSFGKYEGLGNVFDHPEWPVYKLFKDPENYVAEDGAESFEHIFARADDFLNTTVRADVESGKDVLIIAHGAINSALYCRYKKLPLKDFWSRGIPNCKLINLSE